jgi:signal transduction histidine kinase
MTILGRGRRVRFVAWSFAGFTVLVLAAALVLLGLDTGVMTAARIGTYGFAAAGCLVYAGIGRLLAARVPRNAIGWLLCLTGFWLAANLFLEQYGLHGLAAAPGSLPAVRAVAALGQSANNLVVASLIPVVLLFPTGRLPSKWWRPVLWASIWVIVAGGVAQTLQRGTVVAGGLTNALQQAHVAYPNPLGVFPQHGWYSDLVAATAAIAGACALLAVVSVFLRRRGASAELRQQLAWLGYVGALFLVIAVTGITYTVVTHGGNTPLGTALFALGFGIPLLGIPAACAVAVLRYHLYDLDIVVRKTVVAGLVAAAFTAIYALIVLGVGAAVGHRGNSALTFAAAALAAVLLQPLRARAGLLADRLVYGRRATPYEVLSEFAERVAGVYSTDQVLPAIARMLAGATGAERAEVWMQVGGEARQEAAWPAGSPAGQPPPDGADPGPGPVAARSGQTREFTVEHQGERLGSLRLTSGPREPLTPGGARLAQDVAAQAGLVLRNVALIEDLRASRQRIVTAADQARRRIERDLHDGAQQQLVALRINLGLVRQVVRTAPEEAGELLQQTEQAAASALEELRDLARGIYPPLLADLGLRAALEAQAGKATVPVTVEAAGIGRYPQQTEAAVYFCVLEALQNVAKYAQDSSARVTLRPGGRYLAFTVEDDGMGFDPAAAPMGTGLQGISDRLAALGGSVEIVSAPGHGTRVTGRVPAAAGGTSPVPAGATPGAAEPF